MRSEGAFKGVVEPTQPESGAESFEEREALRERFVENAHITRAWREAITADPETDIDALLEEIGKEHEIEDKEALREKLLAYAEKQKGLSEFYETQCKKWARLPGMLLADIFPAQSRPGKGFRRTADQSQQLLDIEDDTTSFEIQEGVLVIKTDDETTNLLYSLITASHRRVQEVNTRALAFAYFPPDDDKFPAEIQQSVHAFAVFPATERRGSFMGASERIVRTADGDTDSQGNIFKHELAHALNRDRMAEYDAPDSRKYENQSHIVKDEVIAGIASEGESIIDMIGRIYDNPIYNIALGDSQEALKELKKHENKEDQEEVSRLKGVLQNIRKRLEDFREECVDAVRFAFQIKLLYPDIATDLLAVTPMDQWGIFADNKEVVGFDTIPSLNDKNVDALEDVLTKLSIRGFAEIDEALAA